MRTIILLGHEWAALSGEDRRLAIVTLSTFHRRLVEGIDFGNHRLWDSLQGHINFRSDLITISSVSK